MSNSHLPLFVMMTCLNGYFHDATTDSLAEGLIKAPRGGAIAVWASSALTLPQGQALMNQQFYRLIFDGTTLGEAAMKAKATVADSDIRKSWILLADPSIKIK